MHKVHYIHLNSESILMLKDKIYWDYFEHKGKTLSDLKKIILFLNQYDQLVLVNLPTILWGQFMTLDLKNKLYIFTDLKTRTGYTIELFGDTKTIRPENTIFYFKDPLIFKWYTYWLRKGVFNKTLEEKLSKLNYPIP